MPPPSAKQFSGIFISYRRDDSAGHAGRLSDKLSDHFGKDQIFMDIDNVQPGEDFVQAIEDAVSSCEILIAIIGRHWLQDAGKTSRWLDSPNDFVRLEIAAALNRGIRVIPVLVQGATMPEPQDLPEDLTKLSRRNALELTNTRWQRDVEQLINAIEKIRNTQAVRPVEPQPQPFPPRKRALLIIAATLFVGSVIGVVLFSKTYTPPIEPSGSTNVNASSNATPGDPKKDRLTPPAGMVYVPGGEFTMGRDAKDGGDEYESPAHTITVKPFFIDIYEVTRKEYKECVDGGQCPQPQGWNNAKYPAGTGRQPVTGVDWEAANAYATAVKKRLPTEEEWEFAARGTDGRRYPWGNDWSAGLANAAGASTRIRPGGTYTGTSPFGAYDMVGNAWEWTASTLTAYSGGSLPEDIASANLRVIRGGTYASRSSQATTTYRRGWPATGADNYSNTGFRCVEDVKR